MWKSSAASLSSRILLLQLVILLALTAKRNALVLVAPLKHTSKRSQWQQHRPTFISTHHPRLHRPTYCPQASSTTTARSSATNNNDSEDDDLTATTLTDWVIEGLETEGEIITTASATKAGENDTLPIEGLPIGDFVILAADAPRNADNNNDDHGLLPIRLLLGRNGWGTGVHPTTRLCLEWLSSAILQGGETVLDYGCGSGILSIAALHQGAARAIGVDVEAEALVTAERNLQLNGYGPERFQGLHTREVQPYHAELVPGVDVCIANILVGQLVRPSMVAAILSNLAPGGWLCLSGIRPNQEVEALKAAYGDRVEWCDEHYAELSAADCPGSFESYGFDTGRWARLVGRRKNGDSREGDIESMSELAVS